jgi:diadenosine tetraphosphate (Ap4A) HIT family hydrolase
MNHSSCHLCQPIRGIIAADELWTMALNENQALLGRCYFALNRHETDAISISAAEQTALFNWFRLAKSALDTLFAPDHYNYVLLMNVEPHVHAHIIARYRSVRSFRGESFVDGHFGDHYDPGATHILTDDLFANLAADISRALAGEVGQ